MAAEGERESQAGQRVPGISRGLLREEASVTGGFELMDTQKGLVTVARMARLLGVFRSGFYRWRWALGHPSPWRAARRRLDQRVRRVHADSHPHLRISQGQRPAGPRGREGGSQDGGCHAAPWC